ncbi:MAG TPA: helix-turn-helix domain-containing protein [Kineosporiaceae bacterium]|nr:helix-turn-helix domain-containing protein [Kineosporiaceae bacterium]
MTTRSATQPAGALPQESPPDAPAAAAEPLGRRERKKQDTQRRIFEAAEDLFTRKGYAAVTTQEIAEAADIGAGTLFRYAQNKAELLIMVMNERLRLGARHGLVAAQDGASAAEAVVALVEPLVQAAISQRENTTVYQREVLFGAEGPHRAQALTRIRDLEDAVATVLRRCVDGRRDRTDDEVERAATAVFSVLYLKLVRLELRDEYANGVQPQALFQELRLDVDHLIRGLLGTGTASTGR